MFQAVAVDRAVPSPADVVPAVAAVAAAATTAVVVGVVEDVQAHDAKGRVRLTDENVPAVKVELRRLRRSLMLRWPITSTQVETRLLLRQPQLAMMWT